jgi:hypothetical protein
MPAPLSNKSKGVPTAEQEALQAPAIDPVLNAALLGTMGPFEMLKNILATGALQGPFVRDIPPKMWYHGTAEDVDLEHWHKMAGMLKSGMKGGWFSDLPLSAYGPPWAAVPETALPPSATRYSGSMVEGESIPKFVSIKTPDWSGHTIDPSQIQVLGEGAEPINQSIFEKLAKVAPAAAPQILSQSSPYESRSAELVRKGLFEDLLMRAAKLGGDIPK